MNRLVQDLRYALRQLRESPGFTAVAMIALRANIITAYRATKVDPMVVLRYE